MQDDTPTRPGDEAARRETRRVRRLAIAFSALAAGTYALIVLGALVRAHGAGLACPDWPLCFGEVIPSFDLEVAFEWSHRALAGGIGLAFVALSVSALRIPAARGAVSTLLGIAALLLAAQIVLGALTVWKLLAYWTVTAHLVTGNAFGACLGLTARGLFDAAAPPREPVALPAGARVAFFAAFALLIGQMVLGGLVASRFAGLACPDWPTCIDGAWFPSFAGARGIHLLHRLGAYALVAAIALCAWLVRGTPRLGGLSLVALAVVAAQVAVGVANVLLRIPVEVTGLHSALAAMLVLLWTLSLREVWRASHRQDPRPVLQQRPLAS